jgi:hypothetical protein
MQYHPDLWHDYFSEILPLKQLLIVSYQVRHVAIS